TPKSSSAHAAAGESDRRVEEAEPAAQVGLDRQLAVQLRLQLQLLGVVPFLVLAGRDEGPEGAALVAVHEVHGVLSSVELEDRRQELLAEALLLQPLGDRVGGRHLVLEIRVLDNHPAVAEGIVAAEELRAGL